MPKKQKPQPLEALDLANRVRVERAAIKRGIKTYADAAEVVRTSEAGIPTVDVVGAIDRVGPMRVRTILRKAKVSEITRVGGEDLPRVNKYRRMTVQERHRLITELEARA